MTGRDHVVEIRPADRGAGRRVAREPEAALAFWVLLLLATIVGAGAADLRRGRSGLGDAGVSLGLAAAMAVALAVQLRARRHLPAVYWSTVVLASAVGVLISDGLVEAVGLSRATATLSLALALTVALLSWSRWEGTGPSRTSHPHRRQGLTWLTALVALALGSSAGDLVSEQVALGSGAVAVAFGAMLTAVTLAYWAGVSSVLTFWSAYLLTGPFGVSVVGLLAATHGSGGAGVSAEAIRAGCLVALLVAVCWLTVRRRVSGPGIPTARRSG